MNRMNRMNKMADEQNEQMNRMNTMDREVKWIEWVFANRNERYSIVEMAQGNKNKQMYSKFNLFL